MFSPEYCLWVCDHHPGVLKVQELSSLGRGLHSPSALVYLFIWVITSLSTHCVDHIMTDSFIGSEKQYIQLAKVLFCKLPANGKQLPAFSLEVRPGFKLQSQQWDE